MSHLRTEAPRNHHVSVTYGDGFHAFRLARGATLGELAVRVGSLDALHGSAPLTIEIVVERTRSEAATTPAGSIISH